MLRIGINVLFILTKKKVFLLLQALLLFVRVIIFQGVQTLAIIPMILADVASAMVWSLTLEQKNIHFDSRLSLKNIVIKKVLIYIIFIYWLAVQAHINLGSVFYLIITILMAINDKYDVVYNRRFK